MHLNKVLVLGCSRSGTTEFCKTLQEISSKKFFWEPELDKHNKIIRTLGYERFFENIYKDKNTFGIKFGVYPSTKGFKKILIDYHDIIFFLSRRNVFQQALSLNLAKKTDKWRAVDFGVETLTEREKQEYNEIRVSKINIEDIKKDIEGIKQTSIEIIDLLKIYLKKKTICQHDW